MADIFGDNNPAEKAEDVKPFKERCPSMWFIEAGEEDGTIVAVAHATKERFEGTVVDFNARLK